MNHDFNYVPGQTPSTLTLIINLKEGLSYRCQPTTNQNGIKDDEFYLICSGGFWSNIKLSDRTYKELVEIGIKPIDTDRRYVDMWNSPEYNQNYQNFLDPPEGSLFGDGPEFNAQKTVWASDDCNLFSM